MLASIFAIIIAMIWGMNSLDIKDIVAKTLQAECGQNNFTDPDDLTCFDSEKIPSYPIRSYIELVSFYANCSDESLVIAVIYMDRIFKRTHVTLTRQNIHRLFAVSLLVATKYNEDFGVRNQGFTLACGIRLKELNMLEMEFLYDIDFHLFISADEYDEYIKALKNYTLPEMGQIRSTRIKKKVSFNTEANQTTAKNKRSPIPREFSI